MHQWVPLGVSLTAIFIFISRYVASLRAGLTLMIVIAYITHSDWPSVSSCLYSLRASETMVADATPVCYLCGVATGQPSTNDGPTCNTS